MELIQTPERPSKLSYKMTYFFGADVAPLDLSAAPLPAKSKKHTWRYFGVIEEPQSHFLLKLGVRSYFSFITLDILCLGPCMVLMDKISIYEAFMTSRNPI